MTFYIGITKRVKGGGGMNLLPDAAYREDRKIMDSRLSWKNNQFVF